MHAWQSEWEALTQRASEPSHAARSEETRIHHLASNVAQIARRREQLEAERDALDTRELEARQRELEGAVQAAEDALAEAETAAEAERDRIGELRARADELDEALHEARGRQQAMGGRLASLQALQQEALGKSDHGSARWLEAHGLDGSARLAERLEVEPGWETAVERLLGARLESVCVERLDPLAADAGELADGVLGLFEEGAASDAPAPGSIGEKVRAPAGVRAVLGDVPAVETLPRRSRCARGSAPAPAW